MKKPKVSLEQAFDAIVDAGFIVNMSLDMQANLNPKTGKISTTKYEYTVPMNKPFACKVKK